MDKPRRVVPNEDRPHENVIASAPGRLDVMGGIADYSGSLVLQLPLDRRTIVNLHAHDKPTIDVASQRGTEVSQASIPLDALITGELKNPEQLATHFRNENHWAAYIFGVIHGCITRLPDPQRATTFHLHITSTVPEGKGISSSAALEVATLAAVAAFWNVELAPEEIAQLSQWAENHVAGAACGIMDQMTSACGRKDHLLRLRCQPAIIEGHIPIPAGLRFFGIDSGIRHAVTGSDYTSVRTAAFMGYRMIASMAGLETETKNGLATVHDPRWNGYLANIEPNEFEKEFAPHLPERMQGAEFLAKYQATTDTVTRVDPTRTYNVRTATAHPIYENARVERFAELLAAPFDRTKAEEMGRLMRASHESYSACGLGSDGTDLLVQLATERGFFGAKITGGGSGGTVAILATEDSEPAIRELTARYQAVTGREAEVFGGSGPGMET